MPETNSLKSGLEDLKIDRTRGRKPRGRRFSAAWIVAGVAVLVALGAWRGAALFLGPPEVDLHLVTVPRAGSAGPAIVLQAAGYVVPHYRIEVASKVVGRVKWMGVEKGDFVEHGQPIVRLEDEEYQARLAESIGTLRSWKARLAELEAGSRPEEIDRAGADLREARAQLSQARLDHDRAMELKEEGVISESEYDQAKNSLDALSGRVESLGKTLELLKAGPRQEEIDAARAEVQRAEGSVAYNRTLVEATVIRAPVTGTVLERNVEVGELVTTGFVGERGAKGYVIALADLNDIQVELDISQNDFSRTFMEQNAIVSTDAYRDREYSGRVVEISPEADRQKATVQVKVQILEPDELIRPEMNANVSFLAASREGGGTAASSSVPRVRVPASALVDGNSVFVVVQDRAVLRSVTVLRTTSHGVEIDQGLSGGEHIILSPPEDLEDGDSIRKAKS